MLRNTTQNRGEICSGDLRLPKEEQETEPNTTARPERKIAEKGWYIL